MGITVTEYQDRIFNVLELIKTNLITPITGDSLIKTRYITSEGVNDEQWIGYLRDEERNNQVDIWLITLAGGSSFDDNPMGAFDKPLQVYVEYLSDYRQGLDYDDSDPDNIQTNSEREFLKKVFAFDFKVESLKGCLGTDITVISHSFQISIKQFSSDSCHRAQFVLNLKLDGNLLGG